MFRLAVCLISSLLITSYAETEIGECPDVIPFAELEVVPYLGRWYENQRYNMIFEGSEDCNMAIYSNIGDGTVRVHNTGRTPDHYFTDIYGSAVVIAPGTLSVSFPGFPKANYTVLGTDYTSYSSVYTCNQNGQFRSLYAWILTRDDPASEGTILKAQEHFVANGIDLNLFNSTVQGGDCPYYKP